MISFDHLLLALTFSFIYLVYRHIISPFFLSPLSSIPNAHPTAPLSSRWIDRKRSKGTEVLAIYAQHQKHGPIVRLGPRELSVNSLQGLRIIYTGAFEKDAFYNDVFVNFNIENMVGMLHNAPHAHQKRMLSKIYSKSFLQQSADLDSISRHILSERLMPILKKSSDSQEVVNVLPLFQAIGMDFTSSFLFGLGRGTEYSLKIPEWMVWLEEYERFKYMSRHDRYMGFIERWCLELCERAEVSREDDTPSEGSPSTNAVVYEQLRQSLAAQKCDDDRPSNLAIASELLDHLVAGHETTGITVTYMMWELSRNSELQAELRRELLHLSHSLENFGTDGAKSLPSSSAIDALPLLDAVVRETLRLHSPAPAQLPRVTPETKNGISLHGHNQIPGGVKISSTAYSLHRISEVFPNPLEWLPQRWLDAGERIHDMRRLFWPFGSGGRMCLGSNFALQEIKLVVAAVYSNYATTIIDDEGIEQDYAFISLPRGRKLMLKFTPAVK
ncbi:unnamed protein product [Penicillium olsonii]|nr:unnamed protein product [Penicillium olsonii]